MNIRAVACSVVGFIAGAAVGVEVIFGCARSGWVVTASVVATIAAGLGVWRWKKLTAVQAALIATAVAIGAASVVLVMVQVYDGDELGEAIPWIERTGVVIAGISLGAFALCFVCLVAALIERVRKRIK